MYARVPLSRARIALFVGLAIAILAFAIYVLFVSDDLTALLVGLMIVSLLYCVLILLRPPAVHPPATRLP
jgi:NADH:ubiquinone oxidoreductase subunit 2 (subunit N)